MSRGPGDKLGDSAVMHGTMRIRHDDGGEELSFKLPLGGEVRSGPLPPKMEAKHMMSWCANVRQAINDEAAEHAAKEKREESMSLPAEPAPKVSVATTSQDPMEYLQEQKGLALVARLNAKEDLEAAQKKFDELEAVCQRWTNAVEAMRGLEDE